jgi:hypothetical protein
MEPDGILINLVENSCRWWGDKVDDDPATLVFFNMWLCAHHTSSRWLSIHKSKKGDGGDEVAGYLECFCITTDLTAVVCR